MWAKGAGFRAEYGVASVCVEIEDDAPEVVGGDVADGGGEGVPV